MSDTLKALEEMQRLMSPFPRCNAVRDWKDQGKKVVGYISAFVPEELIHAAEMLPFHVTGDNEQIRTQGAEAYLFTNTCSFSRACLQLALDGKYDFLDGLVTSQTCDGDRRLHDNWLRYKKLPYMDVLYPPRKWTEDAVQMFLTDLEEWRTRLSALRGARISDNDLKRSIEAYNRGRELMQTFYELRKRERPPVTGAESLEVIKAASRLPREQFNVILGQLLDEIEHSGREIRKSKRLMILGSELSNSNWIKSIEDMDAIVVTDELDTGTRYFWGKVDTSLPPMEALARYYLSGRPAHPRVWPSGNRFEHIFNMADEYKVDGVVSEIIRYCSPFGLDKTELKEQMDQRGIPILELDMEYGEAGSGQMKLRTEAFIEMLHSRMEA